MCHGPGRMREEEGDKGGDKIGRRGETLKSGQAGQMFQAIKTSPSETYQNAKQADVPWAGKEVGRTGETRGGDKIGRMQSRNLKERAGGTDVSGSAASKEKRTKTKDQVRHPGASRGPQVEGA